jgi:hypothetical protein
LPFLACRLEPTRKLQPVIYLLAGIASLGGVLFGYQTGVAAGALHLVSSGPESQTQRLAVGMRTSLSRTFGFSRIHWRYSKNILRCFS